MHLRAYHRCCHHDAPGTLINVARGSLVDEEALVISAEKWVDSRGGARRIRERAKSTAGAFGTFQRRAFAPRGLGLACHAGRDGKAGR